MELILTTSTVKYFFGLILNYIWSFFLTCFIFFTWDLCWLSSFLLNKTIDVLLYVDRLDAYRVDNLDKLVSKAITDSFGKGIWKKAIITLTHAQFSPPDDLPYDEFSSRRSEALLKVVKAGARIKKDASQVYCCISVIDFCNMCIHSVSQIWFKGLSSSRNQFTWVFADRHWISCVCVCLHILEQFISLKENISCNCAIYIVLCLIGAICWLTLLLMKKFTFGFFPFYYLEGFCHSCCFGWEQCEMQEER